MIIVGFVAISAISFLILIIVPVQKGSLFQEEVERHLNQALVVGTPSWHPPSQLHDDPGQSIWDQRGFAAKSHVVVGPFCLFLPLALVLGESGRVVPSLADERTSWPCVI